MSACSTPIAQKDRQPASLSVGAYDFAHDVLYANFDGKSRAAKSMRFAERHSKGNLDQIKIIYRFANNRIYKSLQSKARLTESVKLVDQFSNLPTTSFLLFQNNFEKTESLKLAADNYKSAMLSGKLRIDQCPNESDTRQYIAAIHYEMAVYNAARANHQTTEDFGDYQSLNDQALEQLNKCLPVIAEKQKIHP